jgi:hypothetical protein
MRLTYDLSDPLALLRGLPFLEEQFAAKRLLAAVAAARHVTAERDGKAGRITDKAIETWLAPSGALLLAGGGPIPAIPLAPAQKNQVNAALRELGSLVPAWASPKRRDIRVVQGVAATHPSRRGRIRHPDRITRANHARAGPPVALPDGRAVAVRAAFSATGDVAVRNRKPIAF